MLKLYKKIALIQREVESLVADGDNPYYNSKYVKKDSLHIQLKPYFEKHNVLCIQPPQGDRVETRLICLDSGEELVGSINFPLGITDPQRILACLTYFDRGSLVSMLGLPSHDDDGTTASGKKPILYHNTPQFANVVDHINKGKATIEEIEKEYFLKKSMKDQLNKLININKK